MAHRGNKVHIAGWRAVLLMPLAIPTILFLKIFEIEKSAVRTPAEVAGFIRDFLDGTGGEWDWDDFTSVPIKNAEQEAIRTEADGVPLPLTATGREKLQMLLTRAEALKTAWLCGGQPE